MILPANNSSRYIMTSFMMMLVVVINFMVSRVLDNGTITFFIGTIISALFLYDILRYKLFGTIYQVILVYLYINFVFFYNSNEQNYYYFIAWIFSLCAWAMFVLGYSLKINYKAELFALPKDIKPKANIFGVSFLLFSLVSSILFFLSNTGSYSDQFLSDEAVANLPIYSMFLSTVLNGALDFFVFVSNTPLFYMFYAFFNSLFSFLNSGIKIAIVSGVLVTLLIYQIILGKKITSKYRIIVILISIFMLPTFVNTAVLRGKLGEGYVQNIYQRGFVGYSESDSLVQFKGSPEGSHILYTADIIERLDKGELNFRYGFDYYRFFLYPFKKIIGDFEYSSYNQYPLIKTGIANQGLYLGLPGEVYWNFGFFGIIFMFFIGYLLAWFSNNMMSGNFIYKYLYIMMTVGIIWFLYRGSGNAMVMSTVMKLSSIYVVYIILKMFYKQHCYKYFYYKSTRLLR